MKQQNSTPGAVNTLLSKRRFKWPEALPWIAAILFYFFLPQYIPLGTQILVMVLFALSLDLILGYAGVVVLGHAAFYGMGAYAAGILAVAGFTEPVSNLLIAGASAALLGLVTGVVILRTSGLALLMLSMAVGLIVHELANRMRSLTGGFDGLRGINIDPIFSTFKFDFYGHTAYLYTLAVLFLAWLAVRTLVNAPFGRSLVGIRENPARMEAIGTPVRQRKLIAFVISAGIAGLAGALNTHTNQFVSLNVLSFDLSGAVLVILVLGGIGRLYGAFIGAPLYMIAQDMLSKDDPVYWLFWLGLILIGVVLFARGGVLGIIDRLRQFKPVVAKTSGKGIENAGQ